MLIDDANADLRAFGESLFTLVSQLGGGQPTSSADWYRTEIAGAPALYFRFIGNRARTYPKNSVHLSTQWRAGFASIDGVEKKNNWYGSQPSADVCARPGYPNEIENARKFIRRAFGSTIVPKPMPAHEPSISSARVATTSPIPLESNAFPFRDCGEIIRLSTVYWELINSTEATEERRFEQDFAEARKQGFLSKDLFVRVARWKSVRNTSHYQSNSIESIRAATAKAFTAANDASALAALMQLQGVALRTASAILHWMRPDQFPILDVRVVAALGLAESASYEDFEFYSLVASEVRGLARECDIDLRIIDRALWTWDKLRSRMEV
ncbi:MAG: hypothetical protein IPM20_07985 [Gammaproteobacteria bacterium]|nr:hypothetical protein [Gammaproteobacteria bacterium]